MKVGVGIIGILTGLMSLGYVKDLFFPKHGNVRITCDSIEAARSEVVVSEVTLGVAMVIAAIFLIVAAGSLTFRDSRGMLVAAGIASLFAGLFSLFVAAYAADRNLVSCSSVLNTAAEGGPSAGSLLFGVIYFGCITAAAITAVVRAR